MRLGNGSSRCAVPWVPAASTWCVNCAPKVCCWAWWVARPACFSLFGLASGSGWGSQGWWNVSRLAHWASFLTSRRIGRVFAFTAAISLFTGVAIGLWPAIKASLSDVSLSLQQSSFGPAGGRHKRNFLIGAQVAACLMLLAGAGLLFRGAWRSSAIDPGFDLRHILVVGITSQTLAPTAAAQTELVRHAVDRIAAIPGVASVGWADRAPVLAPGA